MSASTNIGFIGGGNMSTAIFNGIRTSEAHPCSKIWVSGPHIDHICHWGNHGAHTTTENNVVFDACEIIFLGVKPDLLNSVLKSIKDKGQNFKRRVVFVSMLAGKTIETIQKALLNYFCECDFSVVRIMPNTPITVGAGICLYTPDETVTESECKTIEKLLGGSALCEKVSESMMSSLGSLIACGPAFMCIVIEALADGAVKQGVPRVMALKFAAKMVAGSGELVLKTGKHPSVLKDEVCSPGGTTICGVAALENGGLRAAMINAIEAAAQKSKDLGK